MSLEAGALTALKTGILTSVQQRLVPPVNRACVVPGATIAWDDCECGQLTVHHLAVWPSRQFPNPIPDAYDRCEVPWWAVQVVVTVLRCVPDTADDSPPSCDALAEATAQQDADVAAMQRGVICALVGTRHKLMEHRPVGTEGLCGGSELSVIVALGNCKDEC